jgi:hypothetical protein
MKHFEKTAFDLLATAFDLLADERERAAYRFAVAKQGEPGPEARRVMNAVIESGLEHHSMPDAPSILFSAGAGVGFYACSLLRHAEIADLRARIAELERAKGAKP